MKMKFSFEFTFPGVFLGLGIHSSAGITNNAALNPFIGCFLLMKNSYDRSRKTAIAQELSVYEVANCFPKQ